jgi:uncharacterized membrane protein YkoI
MKRNHWLLIGLVAVLLVAAGSAFVINRQPDEHRSPHEHGISIQGQPVIELARALEIAGKHVHGEVVKVELERDDERFTYEIKVLADNGRVREIKLDAHTGALIEIEDD